MRFKSNSIFKVFCTYEFSLSYTETYSMKHSWVLQASKFIPLSESHWNRELRLESIFTNVESVTFFIIIINIAGMYWILIYCINAYLCIYVQKLLLGCSCTVFEIWTYFFSTHTWRNHDNMVFLLLFTFTSLAGNLSVIEFAHSHINA